LIQKTVQKISIYIYIISYFYIISILFLYYFYIISILFPIYILNNKENIKQEIIENVSLKIFKYIFWCTSTSGKYLWLSERGRIRAKNTKTIIFKN